MFDVQQHQPTEVTAFATHAENTTLADSPAVAALLRKAVAGLDRIEGYAGFSERVRKTKRGLLKFLFEAKEEGKTIVGYGAAAKGNTLLNYCGVGPELLAFTVDRNPHKQGRYLPGSRIPILPPERLLAARPDYVFILPWNLEDEIASQMAHIREWEGASSCRSGGESWIER